MFKDKLNNLIIYLFYKYILIKSFIINRIDLIRGKLFNVIKIYEINRNLEKKNLIYHYYSYKIVKQFKFYVDILKKMYPKISLYLTHIDTLINKSLSKLDKNMHIIKVETTNGKVNRNFVFVEKNMEYIYTKINNINYDINELMLTKNTIIKEINLVNEKNNVIELRNLIENYADRSKYYSCHTLRNILKLKNICHDDSNLIIEQIVIPNGKIKKTYTIEKVLDMHISDIYEL